MTIERGEAVVPGCRDVGEYTTRHRKAPWSTLPAGPWRGCGQRAR